MNAKQTRAIVFFWILSYCFISFYVYSPSIGGVFGGSWVVDEKWMERWGLQFCKMKLASFSFYLMIIVQCKTSTKPNQIKCWICFSMCIYMLFTLLQNRSWFIEFVYSFFCTRKWKQQQQQCLPHHIYYLLLLYNLLPQRLFLKIQRWELYSYILHLTQKPLYFYCEGEKRNRNRNMAHYYFWFVRNAFDG